MFLIAKNEQSMSSIKSLHDVREFVSEQIILPYTALECFIGLDIEEKIKIEGESRYIYSGDEIVPRGFAIESNKFYERDRKGFMEVNPFTYGDLSSLYFAESIKHDPIPIMRKFGNNLHFGMSVGAKKHIFLIHLTLCFMSTVPVHKFDSHRSEPDIENVIPGSGWEKWRDGVESSYLDSPIYKNFTKEMFAAVLSGISFAEYQLDFTNTYGKNFKHLYNELTEFCAENWDCFYYLDWDNYKIVLKRGIDHKYLPYYENLFKEPEDEQKDDDLT